METGRRREETEILQPLPRPATLKRINMRRFLEELRRRGPSTRAELTRATGVAPPTSSSIIADLLETGWLEQADDRAALKGRPGKVFRLATSSAMVMGVLIQVEECLVAPAGLDGIPRLAEAQRFATPRTYPGLLDAIVARVSEFVEEVPGKCLGLGVAVPGLVAESLGRVSLSPNLHFLDGKPLVQDLSRRLEMDVVSTQEEHALCLAEQHLGGARNLSDFAVVDISAGMGMGVVSGGRYVSGRSGFAGEIGHVTVEPNGMLCGCGNRGCLETVATDIAFLHAAKAALGREVGFEEIGRLVSSGDPVVTEQLERTLGYLAIALAAVVNLFNPEAIFLHGRILDVRPDVLATLSQLTRERALRPSFEDAKLLRAQGDKLYGALAGLLDRVFAAVGPSLT